MDMKNTPTHLESLMMIRGPGGIKQSDANIHCADPPGSLSARMADLLNESRAIELELIEIRHALTDCRDCLGEAARDEINIADEMEKWDRAYAHLIPTND